MFRDIIADGLGLLLIVTGIFDAYKYHWGAKAIRKARTARGHSRKFMNVAIWNDATRIAYLSFRWDAFLMISSLLAIICMLEMWWAVYWFYPYKRRKQKNFKRPSLMVYVINSIQSNKTRKRL